MKVKGLAEGLAGGMLATSVVIEVVTAVTIVVNASFRYQEWVMSLAGKTPVCHIRVPGFNSWFWFLTPSSC